MVYWVNGSPVETSAQHQFVFLSGTKDLVFDRNYEILRSLCSLRMTNKVTFAAALSGIDRLEQSGLISAPGEFSCPLDRVYAHICEQVPVRSQDHNPIP